jgi:hypothetical protein
MKKFKTYAEINKGRVIQQDSEEQREKLEEWLKGNIDKKAIIFYYMERNKGVPRLSRLHAIFEFHAVFEYNVYDTYGLFLGHQYVSVNYHSLICGEERIVFIDE